MLASVQYLLWTRASLMLSLSDRKSPRSMLYYFAYKVSIRIDVAFQSAIRTECAHAKYSRCFASRTSRLDVTLLASASPVQSLHQRHVAACRVILRRVA